MVITATPLCCAQDAVAARPAYSGLAHAALTRLRSSHLLLRLRARMMTFPLVTYILNVLLHATSSLVRDELSQGALLSDPLVSDTWSQGT